MANTAEESPQRPAAHNPHPLGLSFREAVCVGTMEQRGWPPQHRGGRRRPECLTTTSDSRVGEKRMETTDSRRSGAGEDDRGDPPGGHVMPLDSAPLAQRRPRNVLLVAGGNEWLARVQETHWQPTGRPRLALKRRTGLLLTLCGVIEAVPKFPRSLSLHGDSLLLTRPKNLHVRRSEGTIGSQRSKKRSY